MSVRASVKRRGDEVVIKVPIEDIFDLIEALRMAGVNEAHPDLAKLVRGLKEHAQAELVKGGFT